MKRLLKPFKTNKAEGYIDTVVCVMAAMMVIVLALNVFSFLTLGQDMDHFARNSSTQPPPTAEPMNKRQTDTMSFVTSLESAHRSVTVAQPITTPPPERCSSVKPSM